VDLEAFGDTELDLATHSVTGLSLDELQVGDDWISPSRTITETDVINFAGLSGDFNPIHVNHQYARESVFGKPVAHGLLGLAIASGLATQAPRVRTIALLAILEWKFVEPLAPGDTIHVETRIEAIESRSRGRRGVVTWRRRLVNQDGVVIQEGRLQTLVQGKDSRSVRES
jgi:3-hydroxybutyryl-CoA dehydratase